MSGDVPHGPPTVVKVGSGGYLEWTGEDLSGLSAGRLLKALKHDELFETKLASVALDDCKVFVLPDAGTEPVQLGREGDEFATVAEVRARAASTAPIIRIRVELPAPPAAAGGDAMTALGAQLGAMSTTLSTLVKEKTTPDYAMSEVSSKVVGKALVALGMPSAGYLRLPRDLDRYLSPLGSTPPFTWERGTHETDAAGELLSLLESWVKGGTSPPITNLFVDVQRLSSMEFTVEGAGHFSGKPDAIVARRNHVSVAEVTPFVMSAVVSVDWKTSAAMGKTATITSIGQTQAIAFSSPRNYLAGPPIFITDMSSCFRCWMVVGGEMWHLHPENGLTLREGVALIRYFLAHERGTAACDEYGCLVYVSDDSHDGVLPEVPRGSAPSGATAPASHGGGIPGTKGTSSRRGVQASSGLVSGDVSPESADYDWDDFETVVAHIASAHARGGAAKHLSF